MEALSVIHGGRSQECVSGEGQAVRENLARTLAEARSAGYIIGRQVLLGAVAGRIIGYNIAAPAVFHGVRYPLLVETAYGVVKCGLGETQLL